MTDTLKASEQGLQIVELARRRKGWTRTSSPIWWQDANTSRATLRRFWRGIAIGSENFVAICEAVGIRNWSMIVDESSEPVDEVLEELYQQAIAEKALSSQRAQPQPAQPLFSQASHPQAKKVLISYTHQAPSPTLAQEFYQALQKAGHQTFLAGEEQQQGFTWTQRFDTALQQSDYLLLLLYEQAANSEMVTEAVRRAKEIQASRPDSKPNILPLCFSKSLNYDLKAYLQHVPQLLWNPEDSTRPPIQEILSLIANDEVWRVGSDGAEFSGEADPSIVNLHNSPDPKSTPPLPKGIPGENPKSKIELPLPVASPELEIPEGQVELASRFYIPRPPIEPLAIATITQPGALIRIKAPRQMGKTSLMARILYHGAQQGYCTVPLSFQFADAKVFADLDLFLRWFCASIGRRLRVPNRLDEYWDEIFGSKDNCTAYFEEYLLADLDRPLVVGLDEVDRIFSYPAIAADFLGLLRAWHEDAKNREIWRKLRLVVVHSTEAYVPMDLNQSPFNVGLPVELPELTPEQVQQLAKLHELNWSDRAISQLMTMVGGHPYLVRLALYHLARGDMALDKFLQTASTEAGLYRDHLRRHLWHLEQHPELAEAMEDVVAADEPARLESMLAFKLQSMGLVRLEGNDVTPRCQLYRQYFRDRFGAKSS
jgi:AAA-like domain/TIR domain